ncbi:hypothetical protein RGQ15_22260 [Paracoccus sp. MBLB3053]|uniref:Uncharacterized protein n=1 Tax=Paracoccus aurantius TaxID=3073814 RepID=A0ABU2HYY3_9RHOB|nr:hypothetical protein [Paracoccus sp. MBLB3053]MDS9470273.1 hypothetical protein [Paracoccus sp. MBLB3053]
MVTDRSDYDRRGQFAAGFEVKPLRESAEEPYKWWSRCTYTTIACLQKPWKGSQALPLDDQTRADILTGITSAARALSDLDAALHGPDLANLQGKVGSVMATEIVLLRQLAAKLFNTDLPHDPVQITEALAKLSLKA